MCLQVEHWVFINIIIHGFKIFDMFQSILITIIITVTITIKAQIGLLEPHLSPSDMTRLSYIASLPSGGKIWPLEPMGIWVLEVIIAADLLPVSMPFCIEHNDTDKAFLEFILILSTKDFRTKFRTKDFNSISSM